MPPKSFDVDDAVAKLRKCPLFDKLNSGDLASISRDEVQGLFNILDADGTGSISIEDLQMLTQVPDLNIRPDDLKDIIKDCDKSGDGLVDVDEFYKALTQGTLSFNNLVSQLKGASSVKKDECSRQQLMDYMRDEYERNDALCSLPWALTLFLTFLVCMEEHMKFEKAYFMRSALEGEISGEGGRSNHEGPFLERDVHDVPTFWDWMQASLVSGCFKNDLKVFPYPGRIASYNQIIGGIVVAPSANAPEVCSQSTALLSAWDTYGGQQDDTNGIGYCHGSSDGDPSTSKGFPDHSDDLYKPAALFYHLQLEVVREKILKLADDHYVNQNVSGVDVSFLLYNGNMGMMTFLHLQFTFQRDGFIKIAYDSESWVADPYYHKVVILCDLIFAILLTNMAWGESKEMFPALQNGLDGFLDYWEFWNAVDWAAIFGGAICMGIWGGICNMVSNDLQAAIALLPLKELDEAVINAGQFLTEEDMSEIVSPEKFEEDLMKVHEAAANIQSMYYLLRWLLAVYAGILMMKFFKAFQANPRLNVVTQTAITGSTAIIHFFLVFFVIFLVFAVMATVLFGHKIKEFSSFAKAMSMCWRILMGDFDYDEMEAVDWKMAIMWFVLFMIIVFLILFNMLLAIVMDTYSAVAGAEENPQTIWFQAINTLKKTQKTRGHLSLWYLICEFEDDDFPAHPDPTVTPKSLRKAFNKMSKHNAEYLVAATNEWVLAQEGHSELSISDAIRLIGRVDGMASKTYNTVFLMHEKMKEEARKPMEKRLDAIMAGEDLDGGGYMPALMNGHPGAHPGGPGHGGVVRAAPDHNMVNAMKQMQTQLEQQQVLIQKQQEYLEQRDAWIEQRIMFMERRSEKVELSAERLIAAMQKLDVDSLATIPDHLENLNQMVGLMHASSNSNQQQVVAHQLQSLNAQVARLQQHADEDSQARNVLYRLDVNGKQMKAAQASGQNDTVNQLRSLGAQINALLYHAEEDADIKKMSCKSTLKQFRAAQTAGREFPLFSQSLPPPQSDGRSRVESNLSSSGNAPGNNSMTTSTLRHAGIAIADQQVPNQGNHFSGEGSRPGSSSSQPQGLPHDFPAPPPPGSVPGQASSSLARPANNKQMQSPSREPGPEDGSDVFV